MPNLGNRVKGTLFNWTRDVLEQLGETIVWILSTAGETFLGILAMPMKRISKELMIRVYGEHSPPGFLQGLVDDLDNPSPVSVFLTSVLILVVCIPATIMAVAAPWSNAMQRKALHVMPSVLAPVDAQVTAFLRGEFDKTELSTRLYQMGFDDTQITTLLKIAEIRPTAFEYSQYWLRGLLSDEEYDTSLRELGYNESDRNVYKTLSLYIPAPPDLIQMAVREVFTPEIAEKFGQFEGFPEAFAEWGAKQGLTREWCMNYWAAHWGLPSTQMGFEMLHRGVISQDELDMLLRAADVMPYWRSKLVDISYNPYTRVDIRRMYGVGILTEEQVNKAYHDIGYDDAHAANLTAFTTRVAKQENKDLAKSEILTGYREKILSVEEVTFSLASIGYAESEIAYLLSLEDSKFAAEQQKDEISLLQLKVRAQQIDITSFQAELGKLNLPATQMDLLVAKETLQSTVKVTLPSKEETIRWYNLGTITSDDATSILDALGYDTKYIDLYLSEVSRAPSVAMAVRWFNKELIDEGTLDKYLKTLGYGTAEREILIAEASSKEESLSKIPSIAVVKKWYSSGRIPETDARNYLIQMGYGTKEIELFITEWTPIGA